MDERVQRREAPKSNRAAREKQKGVGSVLTHQAINTIDDIQRVSAGDNHSIPGAVLVPRQESGSMWHSAPEVLCGPLIPESWDALTQQPYYTMVH